MRGGLCRRAGQQAVLVERHRGQISACVAKVDSDCRVFFASLRLGWLAKCPSTLARNGFSELILQAASARLALRVIHRFPLYLRVLLSEGRMLASMSGRQ